MIQQNTFGPSKQLDLGFFMTESQKKYIHDIEERRRQRNNDILAKIQELRINASTHAARSEKLRRLRDEYEALVDKYSLRGRTAPFEPNYINPDAPQNWKSDLGPVPSFTSTPNPMKPPARESPKLFVSTQSNTDITGPVRALQGNNLQAESAGQFMIEPNAPASKSPEKNDNPTEALRISPIPIPKLNLPPNRTQPSSEESRNKFLQMFLDLSSTDSEGGSGMEVSGHKATVSTVMRAINKLLADETSDNTNTTTSFSVPPPIQVKMAPASQSAPVQEPIDIGGDGDRIFHSISGKEISLANSKKMISNMTVTESPTTSIGDSMMDSVHNKTPDSLPRDESDLEANPDPESEEGNADEDESVEEKDDDDSSDLSSPKQSLPEAQEVRESAALAAEAMPTFGVTIHAVVNEIKSVEPQPQGHQSLETEEGKDEGTEKVKAEKSPDLKQPSRPKTSRKFRLKMGYSDSEGSDFSEIAPTKEMAEKEKPTTASLAKPDLEQKPAEDTEDDFFDF